MGLIMSEKMQILLDITPLKNAFYANSSRSGIFFTLKNILFELLKRPDIELFFYISEGEFMVRDVLSREFPEYSERILNRCLIRCKYPSAVNEHFKVIARLKEHFAGHKIIHFCLRGYNFFLRHICQLFFRGEYSNFNLPNNIHFLSLMYSPDNYIKNNIPADRCYLLLYDLIPKHFPEYAYLLDSSHIDGWLGDVVKNLSAEENYMAISDATRKDFLLHYPVLSAKDISVIHLAAAAYFKPVTDCREFEKVSKKYNIPRDKKIFYSCCSLAPHKNLERLFRAFAAFHKNNSDWVIIFSGAEMGAKKDLIYQIAEENDMPETAFSFIGYVDDEELPILYSLADVFCFVSLYEGFGLPVLEAMQCGCPCLISNTSSLPEIAGDAALQVSPTDIDDIVSGMCKLAGNESLRQEMSKVGLLHAKEFSWSKTTDCIMNALKNNN